MNPRDITLFIHLVCMAIFFMSLGVEILAVMRLVAKPGERPVWLSALRPALSIQQYSMIALFMTGCDLIRHVKPEDLPSFLVTIVVFLVLGGLSGMSSAKYKRAEPDAAPAPFLHLSLRTRLALAASIVLLVSLKPDLVLSIVAFAVFLVIGLAASVPAMKRPA